jgi:hypothetical protein
MTFPNHLVQLVHLLTTEIQAAPRARGPNALTNHGPRIQNGGKQTPMQPQLVQTPLTWCLSFFLNQRLTYLKMQRYTLVEPSVASLVLTLEKVDQLAPKHNTGEQLYVNLVSLQAQWRSRIRGACLFVGSRSSLFRMKLVPQSQSRSLSYWIDSTLKEMNISIICSTGANSILRILLRLDWQQTPLDQSRSTSTFIGLSCLHFLYQQAIR